MREASEGRQCWLNTARLMPAKHARRFEACGRALLSFSYQRQSEGHQRVFRGSSEGHQRVVRGPSSAIGRYLQPWVRMAGVPTSTLDGGVRLAVRALLSQLLSRLCRDVKGEHQSLSVAISHYQSQSVAISRNHAPAPSRNRGYSWVIRCHHAPAPRGSGNTISAPGS